MKHSKFPKIGQYRNVVKEIQLRSAYVGQDRGDNPMYDNTLPKPTITFKGTVKLHGTNSGVGHNFVDGLWVQSKSQIITPENDNYGFATYVYNNEEVFQDLLDYVREVNKGVIGDDDGIVIFGEWAGNGIQKGVAISDIEKSLFIFDVKIVPDNGDNPYYVKSDYLRDNANKIYNVEDFLSYTIDIDFNDPNASQNELIDITQKIEDLCPVGKNFDVEGVGEGCVWTAHWKGNKYRFKVKGDKHAGKSKVKVLSPVDEAKLSLVKQTAYLVTPVWRLNQFFNEVTKNGEEVDRKYIGDFIRAVIKDVMEEDADIIADAGLTPKEVNPSVSKIAKDYFFEQEKL